MEGRFKMAWVSGLDKGLTILCVLASMIVIYLFLLVFCVSMFKVSSDSMEPGIATGSRVVLNKLCLGPRLFNVFDVLRRKRVKIYRLPGFGEVRRNDVLVFNNPYPYGYANRIRLDATQYLVKRCVGLPGDSLSICDGLYQVTGFGGRLGDSLGQEVLRQESEKSLRKRRFFYTYPPTGTLGWNVRWFGPLYIPRKGDRISLTSKNVLIYKNLIEWECQGSIRIDSSGRVFVDDEHLKNYCFEHDYYFLVGDNAPVSYDSRFWGLLPDDFIVGKVCFSF